MSLEMGSLKKLGLLVAILALPPLAQGHSVELSFLGGYRLAGTFPSSAYDNNNTSTTIGFEASGAFQYGIALDTPLDPDWLLGMSWDRQESTLERKRSNTPTDAPLLYLQIDYYHLNVSKLFEGKKWVPYLQAGLGVTHMNPHGDYDGEIRMSWNFGGGLRHDFNEKWGMRALARVRSTLTPNAGELFCSAGGSCFHPNQLWMWQGDAIGGITYRLGF